MKSKASRRVVPVGQVVIEALAVTVASQPTGRCSSTSSASRCATGGGGLWPRLRLAGRRNDVTAHTLRHFFASALISGGATVKQVQTVLGHSSAVVTLQTYAHLWPGDDDRTRDLADAALAPLADSLRTAEAVDA